MLSVALVLVFCIESGEAATISTNQLDTADTFKHNEFDLTLFGLKEANGNIDRASDGVRFRYGITDRLTASLTLFSNHSGIFTPALLEGAKNDNYQFDIKYQLRREKLRSPGCAIGVNGLTLDNPEVFVVFTKHATTLVGFHSGVKLNTFGIKDSPRPFASIELNPIQNVVRLTVDYQWNFRTAKAGVLGLGAYYYPNASTELGIKWFYIDEFNNANDSLVSRTASDPSGFLMIQYLYRF